VLFVEAAQDRRFGYDDEDALVAVAGQLGSAIHVLQASPDSDDAPAPASAAASAPSGPPLAVRHFAENDSVFLGGDYLIKGVAGSIFHALVADFLATGRTEFSNRELRLDPRVKLPDLSDNLEARLILLARRLAERDAGIRIEKAGRGRLRLAVSRPLELVEVAAP
jgi:adenylate cyclase